MGQSVLLVSSLGRSVRDSGCVHEEEHTRNSKYYPAHRTGATLRRVKEAVKGKAVSPQHVLRSAMACRVCSG